MNLDGKVQVKKVNSVQWMNADYQLTLDKGDLIQTDSEGVARIAFADGTTYTVKGDTLVTVEENNVAAGPSLRRSPCISAPARWTSPPARGKSLDRKQKFPLRMRSLRCAQTAARLSAAIPDTKEQEITVDSGSAELNRGNEHLDIGQWERVTFPHRRTDHQVPGARSSRAGWSR